MHYIKQNTSPSNWKKSYVSFGFTLVELIVVVTILAILATIGFVSYSSYLTGVRDTNRLAQLVSIHDWLTLYSTRKDLPLPDDNVEISISTNIIAYQWYAWSNTLETIDFTKGWVDPRDKSYFSYYLTSDRKKFQLLAFLEEDANITSNLNITNSVQAVDYSNRIPTTYGRKLWILTDSNNTPIQEISDIKGNWGLDISTTTETYKAHISDTKIVEWDSTELVQLNWNSSCARIKEVNGSSTSWVYKISIDGINQTSLYCNMSSLDNILKIDWEIWTWATPNFQRNGSASENERELWINPFWYQSILRKAIPDSWNDADWWWNSISYSVDKTKTYRLSVWLKKTWDINGTTYLWTQSWIWNLDGSVNGNPYFWAADLPELDKWFLVVWYVHPEWYTWTSVQWWIYQAWSNNKIAPTTLDFKFLASTTWILHRSYLFYNTNTTNRQYFYEPRIDVINPNRVWDVSDLINE